MTTIRMHFKKWPVFSGLSMFFLAGTFCGGTIHAHPKPARQQRHAQDSDNYAGQIPFVLASVGKFRAGLQARSLPAEHFLERRC